MRLSWRGWYAVCNLICAFGYPTMEQWSKMYVGRLQKSDLESQGTRYVFDGIHAPRISKVMEDELEDLRNVAVPLKSSVTTVKNDYVLSPRTLEPDAEMLPLHYKGVKSPGVDHMELISLEPRGMASDLQVSQTSPSKELGNGKSTGYKLNTDSKATMTQYDTDSGKHQEGGSKAVDFESGSKGSVKKEDRKREYEEDGGNKKTRSHEDKATKKHADAAHGKERSSFRFVNFDDSGRKKKGFNKKYHKDEYKKDADFYNNDHKGGSFVNHGRYDEKHIIDEGEFKKSGNQNSGMKETAGKKDGRFEIGQSNRDLQGYKSQEEYEDFFKRFGGFGKKGDVVNGKLFQYQKGDSDKTR